MNFLYLIQGDIGIFDDVDLAGFAMLVDAEDAAGGGLIVSFPEEFLALQHDGQDVAGVLGVLLVFFDQGAQQFLGALFRNCLRSLAACGGGEDGAP